jgi:hypothetical protein
MLGDNYDGRPRFSCHKKIFNRTTATTTMMMMMMMMTATTTKVLRPITLLSKFIYRQVLCFVITPFPQVNLEAVEHLSVLVSVVFICTS